jgi:hypothetical protein
MTSVRTRHCYLSRGLAGLRSYTHRFREITILWVAVASIFPQRFLKVRH